jgi:hypothetical protein
MAKPKLDDLAENIHELTHSIDKLTVKIARMHDFILETQIQMARNMQDLHNRLNYIKDYIGIDAFMSAVKDEQMKLAVCQPSDYPERPSLYKCSRCDQTWRKTFGPPKCNATDIDQ